MSKYKRDGDNYSIPFWLKRDINNGKKEIKHISFTIPQLKKCMMYLGIDCFEVITIRLIRITKSHNMYIGVTPNNKVN